MSRTSISGLTRQSGCRLSAQPDLISRVGIPNRGRVRRTYLVARAEQSGRGSKMRKASMYVALCGLVGACSTATATAAAASRTPTTKASAKHSTPPKVGTIHMKLLAQVSPAIPEYSPREGWLFTDGVRWAAYESRVGTTRLIDTASGRSFNRTDPEECAGGLLAVGGGELLYECEDPECPDSARSCMTPVSKSIESIYWSRRYISEDIEGGANHIVAGISDFTLPPKEGFSLTKIGSNWIYGDLFDSNYHAQLTFFLNWRTGAIVQSGHAPNAAWNLSLEKLAQPLCTPLRWTPDNYFFGYERPFAVTGTELPEPGPQGTKSKPLRLLRCGSHAEEVLTGPTPPSSSSVQLGGRVVSWIGSLMIDKKTRSSTDAMYLTSLYPRGRKWHGRVYQLRDGSGELLQHTANEVFTTNGGRKMTDIYYGRIPKS
jgi:hypothetical protein